MANISEEGIRRIMRERRGGAKPDGAVR